MNNIKLKSKALFVVTLALAVLVLGNVVKAQTSGSFLDLVATKVAEQLLGSQSLGGGEEMLGASNYRVEYVPDYRNGIYVGGVAVIDSSGNWDGAITGTTGTFSSTLGVTGATTLASTLDVTGATSLTTLTQGGGMYTSSTLNATETLPITAIDTENFIDYTPNVDTTLTLPATSTMTTFLPNAGDTRVIILRNASSTASAALTIAAGTGIDLQFSEATGGDLQLDGLDMGTLTFTRLTNTDVSVLWNEYTEAD